MRNDGTDGDAAHIARIAYRFAGLARYRVTGLTLIRFARFAVLSAAGQIDHFGILPGTRRRKQGTDAAPIAGRAAAGRTTGRTHRDK